MNMGEFRELTKNCPDDLPIIMSSDPEGNGFWPLGNVDIGVFFDSDGYMIEKPDEGKNQPKVICFWAGYDFPS